MTRRKLESTGRGGGTLIASRALDREPRGARIPASSSIDRNVYLVLTRWDGGICSR